MPPDKNPKRPEAAATAIEASGESHTVNFADHSDVHDRRNAKCNNGKSPTRCNKAFSRKPETVLAEVPVPRGIARISVVQEKKGPLIHARRWYDREGTLTGTREGFTIASPEHARMLAQGLLEAATVMENYTVT